MAYGMVMDAQGGPEVLQWREMNVPPPAPHEITIRQSHAGLNFADLMMRSGAAPFPAGGVIGVDGGGIVAAVGDDVDSFSVSDRVAYTMIPGAYVEERNLAAARALLVPADIEMADAVALLSKGLTAGYLLHDLRRLEPGATILVHAASGGVGSLLAQWGSALGLRVIGTVSTPTKADFARRSGCAEVIVRSQEDFVARVQTMTGGAKVDVVYDSIGKDTFMSSLDCIRPRGLMVCYGAASGPAPEVSPAELGKRCSLMLTQTGLISFIATPESLAAGAARLWQAVREGQLPVDIQASYPLREAERAHRDLEGGKRTGMAIFTI